MLIIKIHISYNKIFQDSLVNIKFKRTTWIWNAFTVTFDQFNLSLVNKSINFHIYIYIYISARKVASVFTSESHLSSCVPKSMHRSVLRMWVKQQTNGLFLHLSNIKTTSDWRELSVAEENALRGYWAGKSSRETHRPVILPFISHPRSRRIPTARTVNLQLLHY